MSRATYDRTAKDWRAVSNAVGLAGGDNVAIPTLHLTLILHGYEQMQRERAAALALVETWEQQGAVDNTAAAAMRHALGALSDEQYADHVRAASPAEQFFVDTNREGCVDHIPVANGSCRECAIAQGVVL